MPLSENPELSVLNAKHLWLMLLMGLLSALGFFDFLIFMYLFGELGKLFFLDNTASWVLSMQLAGLFAAGYLARVFGGMWVGRLAQKQGRKQALMVSATLMAGFTFTIGLLPTSAMVGVFASILFLLLRIGQGVALGGLVPVIWVYLAESLPKRYLSISSGVIVASYAFGLMVANIVFAIILDGMGVNAMLSIGWRWMFIISGTLTMILLYYLRQIPMTQIFMNYQKNYLKTEPAHIEPAHIKQAQSGQSVSHTANRFIKAKKSLKHTKDTLKNSIKKNGIKDHINAIFIGGLLSLYISSIFMIVAILLPDLVMAVYPIDADMVGIANGLGLWFLMLGCVFYGFLADRMNPGLVLMGGSVILMAQIFGFYLHLQAGGELLLILYAILGFSAGVIGMIPAQILRMLPTGIRALYFSVIYNVVYAIVGGVLPFVLAYMSATIGMVTALYVAFLAIIGLMLGFILYRLPNHGLDYLDKKSC